MFSFKIKLKHEVKILITMDFNLHSKYVFNKNKNSFYHQKLFFNKECPKLDKKVITSIITVDFNFNLCIVCFAAISNIQFPSKAAKLFEQNKNVFEVGLSGIFIAFKYHFVLRSLEVFWYQPEFRN